MTNPSDADRALARELLWPFVEETEATGGVSYGGIQNAIALALASREAAGYRRGQEEMRERCAEFIERGYGIQHPTKPLGVCISQVDGWPQRATAIRALPITGADNALGLPPLDDVKLFTPELLASLQKRALKLGDDD